MKTFEVTSRVGREPRLDDIRTAAAEALHLRRNAVVNVVDPTKSFQPTMVGADATCYIVRRSIDARGDLKMVYKVEAYGRWEKHVPYALPVLQDVSQAPPVIVVGAGPAGLFAALRLISMGCKPVILERGKDVHRRKGDIARLSREGTVEPDSNYCFGEGGAGTFSDGKLYTRSSKRGDIREVLYRFVELGADPSILVDAHPHIGTDKLPRVIENLRARILEHGGEYHFDSRVIDIKRLKNGTYNVKVVDSSLGRERRPTYKAGAVILATGHSAHDIYRMFADRQWALEAKGFALGVRVEHPQDLVNRMRYRGQWEPGMPAAEYSFVEQVGERGVFSFCMCPGGILVPSATEAGSLVLNGMSNSSRNSKWANAGVVVQVEPEDVAPQYGEDDPLAVLHFQEAVEKKMYDYVAERRAAGDPAARHPQAAPAQRMIDFCNGVVSHDLPATSYHPGAVSAPLHDLLPKGVTSRLREAFPLVNRKVMRGYFTNDALLLGVESRTSSPVRIPREPESLQHVQLPGLFPCGEGAGYSGGIVSSAIDGINCAIAAAAYLHPAENVQEGPDDGPEAETGPEENG